MSMVPIRQRRQNGEARCWLLAFGGISAFPYESAPGKADSERSQRAYGADT